MIDLTLQRAVGIESTPGRLFLETNFECFTLEPLTPIPAGRYTVIITPSVRATKGALWTPDFGFRLPLLVSVPLYEGIRIHAGNSVSNTQGCILVGQLQSGEVLERSHDALRALMAKLKEPISITVLNPKELQC